MECILRLRERFLRCLVFVTPPLRSVRPAHCTPYRVLSYPLPYGYSPP